MTSFSISAVKFFRARLQSDHTLAPRQFHVASTSETRARDGIDVGPIDRTPHLKTAQQIQKAVAAHLKSKQLLLLALGGRKGVREAARMLITPVQSQKAVSAYFTS